MKSHLESVARRKVGTPPEWEVYRWERVENKLHPASGYDDFIVHGGVPRTIKRGSRKGEKTWVVKQSRRVIVTGDEIKEEYERYEDETHKCGECFGDGEVFAGWSITSGARMKTCKRCGGTGKRPCMACGGTKTVEYYHDGGDHFGAGTSPLSEWREKPCHECCK